MCPRPPEINIAVSFLGEDTCWTALIVPSSPLSGFPLRVTNCLPFSLLPVKIWSQIYKRDLFSPTPARYHHSVEKHCENIKGKRAATGERYKQRNDFPRVSAKSRCHPKEEKMVTYPHSGSRGNRTLTFFLGPELLISQLPR